ncbi:MAG: response regulator transcription factor [Acidisphaera sp.]|nr:response regulator transcription factor [Acidisphaera sp.]
MSGARILVIDDEPQIHRFLRPALASAGYDVEVAASGQEGLRLAASRSPEAVLLDLGLPDLDGQAVLRRLRQFSKVPVIVLSARDRAGEKISALDAGADDYVEKPFDLGELLARIRAALRHGLAQDGAAETFRLEGLTVDLLRRQVELDGRPLALSPREYALLALLVRNRGRVLTHRQLLTGVWGTAHAEDVQYLRVYVGQIRQKLGTAIGALIRTEPGIGYRLLDALPDGEG